MKFFEAILLLGCTALLSWAAYVLNNPQHWMATVSIVLSIICVPIGLAGIYVRRLD